MRAGTYDVCEWICEERRERGLPQYLPTRPRVTAEGYSCVECGVPVYKERSIAVYLFEGNAIVPK